jgi:hypothetical protein
MIRQDSTPDLNKDLVMTQLELPPATGADKTIKMAPSKRPALKSASRENTSRSTCRRDASPLRLWINDT